jgi:hypothetical protein
MTKKQAQQNRKEMLKKTEAFVRSALAETSKGRISEAKVKSAAKKIITSLPTPFRYTEAAE